MDESSGEKNGKTSTLWFMIVIFFIFLFAIVVLVVVAMFQSEDLPDKIDVVMVDLGRARHSKQIEAVKDYMPWFCKIHVLSPNPPSRNDYGSDIRFIQWSPDAANTTRESQLKQAMQYIPSLSDVGTHAIFLGDATFPFRRIWKTQLFHDKRPRMCAFLRDEPEANFMMSELNYTCPVMPMEVENMRTAQTVDEMVKKELAREGLFLVNYMNRDVFVRSAWLEDATEQFNRLEDEKPMFATFHISGTDLTAASKHAQSFIDSYFD